jgi:hypothetical protein
LHVDFIFLIKKNYYLGLYYTQQYLNDTTHSLSFLTKFYLYELKKKIINELTKLNNITEGINDNQIKKIDNSKKLLKLKEFFDYTTFLENLRRLMINNCDNYENILKFRNNQSLSKTMTTILSKFTKTENLMSLCIKLNKDNDILLKILKENLKNETKILKHSEICFLLYNFFTIIKKGIPYEIKGLFAEYLTY